MYCVIVECAAGYAGNGAVCNICALGSYTATHGETNCTLCGNGDDGYMTENMGSNSSDVCSEFNHKSDTERDKETEREKEGEGQSVRET